MLGIGAHAVASWRGLEQMPGALTPLDLALMGGVVAVYAGVGWLNLTGVSTLAQIVLSAALLAGLGWGMWRTMQRRANAGDEILPVSPLDGTIDAFLMTLENTTEIRNVPAAANRVRELSREYNLEVDPDAVIEKLPVGTQQRVEIIKALYRKADILILDEPTAVLTPQEGKELFKIMRQLASQGVTIIFITHKLKEVFEVATNIAVMRGGRLVGATTPGEATETSLAAMMVGREVILQVKKGEAHPQDVVLEVNSLSALDNRGANALNGVSFEVRAGEVLGIAGVQGNGQTELVEVLTRLRNSTGGAVTL
ncbi:MAG: ATP-binding cassette domain-containing protein, partial [Anaerolineae bacterium]|nr:ATP-binding cassette domain-containing protein [Anaerolineae bacterium]